MHSHLLPGIDDGVKTLEEMKTIVAAFENMGYTKAITTPHIMHDAYRNTPQIIQEKLAEVKRHLVSEKSTFTIEAAAEYYLDEALMARVESQEPLLTFGRNYLLFETNYLTEPYTLKDFIFKVITQGYQPVMAHPERYHYMTLQKAEDFIDRGVLFQINMLSLSGYYSAPIKKMAEKIIDKTWIHFLGSDCHNREHARLLPAAIRSKGFKKAIELPLLNINL